MTGYERLLQAMRFEAVSATRWERRFPGTGAAGYTIAANTRKGSIDYPAPIQRGDDTTSNFAQQENLVVLECVCRLLGKGYDPATLVLQKRYQLGRGSSGGKSDITVLRRTADPAEQQGADPLLIIECKTWGKEHDAERLKTVADGGQLFGYFQQDRSVKHLCIYSSRLKDEANGELAYRCDIIHVDDTPEALMKFAAREKAESHSAARAAVPLFQHADNRSALHHAWKMTYEGAFQSLGIFEDAFTPYAIGYKPLVRGNLLEFNGENGSTQVFNRFMEILRHNNVSDKENAFNRLCAIILAKLIDENRAPDAVLDFQWFPNRDTDEDLIDRLQRLYKHGMQVTLGEDITYFEEKDIDKAFRAHRRDMAKQEVKQIFRALKFYTNSDFAFKEVHNKQLFEQNAKVVKEVVEIFQGYRMKYTSKEAFLGNLFELLLNSGFKQSEGQFFTPIPIARFIVRCLPLRERMEDALRSEKNGIIPRVMDYACGSAHFLTEAIEEIQQDLAALGRPEATTTTWARDTVWGVEKDYRLARTAKVAMFLHGAGDANILHEDGLAHTNPLLPRMGTVDVLIANPPYSIASFKQHLDVPSRAYTLLPHLTSTASEIETLFVERAAQLLREGGIAGLILPSSILSSHGIYRRTRALLLEKFLLRGIVELGGSTFIATTTNTIVLFLERRPDTDYDHLSIRADALFIEGSGPRDKDFADSDLLRAYATAAGLDPDAYLQWLADPNQEPPATLAGTALFDAYADAFDALPATRNRKKQASFKSQPAAEQETEKRGRLLHYIRDLEREKFLYFSLAYVARFAKGQVLPQRTTTVRQGRGRVSEQAFLGYSWSTRKGREGMAYAREPYDGGLLYSPENRDRTDPADKAAHHIRAAFLGVAPNAVPESAPLHETCNVAGTPAYMDFTRNSCELAISLATAEESAVTEFQTRYESLPFLKIFAAVKPPAKLPQKQIEPSGKYTVIDQSVNDIAGYTSDAGHVITEDLPLILFGDHTCALKFATEPFAQGADGLKILRTLAADRKFAYYLLQSLRLQPRGYQRHYSLLKSLTLPLPPLDVQRRIVADLEGVEASEARAQNAMAAARAAIERVIAEQCRQTQPVRALCSLVEQKLQPQDIPDGDFYHIGLEHIQSGTGRLLAPPTVKGASLKSAKGTFAEGDVLYGRLRPYLNKVAIADRPGICSTFAMALRCETALLLQAVLLRPSFVDSATAKMTGATHPTVAKDDVLDSEVPWPLPQDQQRVVNELAAEWERIAEAEAEIAAAPERKRQILLDGLK